MFNRQMKTEISIIRRNKKLVLLCLSAPRERVLLRVPCARRDRGENAGAGKFRAPPALLEGSREQIREEDASFPRVHRAHLREWSPREMAI